MPEDDSKYENRAIAGWLFVCLSLIFVMVVLGGVTRLTGSGLSMVNWHPVHGVVPPLNTEQWQEEFDNYQKSPEFQKINRDFSVADFKTIFWFEFSHRLLGRLIGIVFLIPFMYFWFRHKIRPGLTPKLIIMFVLGGFQGLLGWYMVKSGLISNPHVSQYRLTAHLISAILIYGFILWIMLDLIRLKAYVPLSNSFKTKSRIISITFLALVTLVIVSGGFVAGLKAGLIFNTFPKMGDLWIPNDLWVLAPVYLNLFENMVTVQFDHRILAETTGLLLLFYYFVGRSHPDKEVSKSFKLIGMMVIIQIILGISTLLMHVPVWLASMHQAGALLLFSVVVMNVHALSRH